MEDHQTKHRRKASFCCWSRRRRKGRKSGRMPEDEDDQGKKKKRMNSPEEGIGIKDEAGGEGTSSQPTAPAMVLHDSFHYFGIPLRTPSEYYEFLELPFREQRKGIEGGAGDEQDQRKSKKGMVNVLGVGKTTKRKGWRSKRGELIKRSSVVDDPTDVPDDAEQCVCTCALPSTSSANAKCEAAPLFGRLLVQLRKGAGQQLGLGIAGGSDRPIPPTISYLRPGFVAHRCDQLQVGDRLVSVNGIQTDTLTHFQVLALLRNAGSDVVELELEYDLNSLARRDQEMKGIRRKTVDVELVEEEGTTSEAMFGITLRGGAFGPDPAKSRPLTVIGIRTGGPAHREGRLRVGDRVLAIDGMSTRECTLSAALSAIREARASAGRILISIEYDVCVLTSLRRLGGPLLLEVEKVAGVDFGTELVIRQIPIDANRRRRAVLITGIVPASIADRCGAVQCGDELLAIDGISLEMIGGLAEAYQLLRSQTSLLRLEMVPGERAPPLAGRKSRGMDPLRRLNSSLLQLYPAPSDADAVDVSATLGRRRPHSTQHQYRQPSLPPTTKRTADRQHDDELRRPHTNNANANKQHHHSQSPAGRRRGSITARLSASPGNGTMGAMCHSESMEVTLAQEPGATHSWASFGIVLGRQRADGATNVDTMAGMPLVIVQIERGSPADKCGVLQPGDRILCINDWQTAEGTLEEAQHLLRACSLSTVRSSTLLVEFTVIEPVLPPGPGSLFVVRLAKRGSSLGIVCRSEHKGSVKGEPLIISDIRMGSVAHRCGSIQVGDRLHSIDNIPLEACTLEEAIRLLQRSAPVVKLCIAKGGGEEQDLLESAPMVVYTVELSRKGHPLGITIASAGGLVDPIVISQLAPGGLAERTGALHVGDRILAINGESLEGKKVGLVTQLLQQCPDPISIKLCRLMLPQGNSSVCGPNFPDAPTAHWRHGTGLYAAFGGEAPIGPNLSDEVDDGNNNNKVGTPMKSVDSAMDSLEDSPPDGNQLRHGTSKLAHLRPSTSNNFQQVDLISGNSEQYSGGGWDSGMSSAAATDSQQGVGGMVQHQPGCQSARAAVAGQERCCGCGATASSSEQPSSSISSSSPQSSAGGNSSSTKWRTTAPEEENNQKEEWVRILEALETVGEEEMLRKLEECILSGQASNYAPVNSHPQRQLLPIASESGVLSRRFLSNQQPSCSTAPHIGHYAKPSMLMNKRANDAGTGSCNSRGATPLAEPKLTNRATYGSKPGTPVLDTNRRGPMGLVHNTSFELPPPMPSPRSASSAAVPSLLQQLNNLASPPPLPNNTSSSTFASSSVGPHHRSSSAIPFITSPIEADDHPQEDIEDEEEADQFDQLSEVFSVQLCRCPLTKSFGFSVCDGNAAEKEESGGGHTVAESNAPRKAGIYVRSVIKEGPADRSGRIRPGDRILQINGRSIQFLTCDLALPLLATERVELLLLRKRPTTATTTVTH